MAPNTECAQDGVTVRYVAGHAEVHKGPMAEGAASPGTARGGEPMLAVQRRDTQAPPRAGSWACPLDLLSVALGS